MSIQPPGEKNRKLKINWEGSLFVHHSLGMVNRELLTELLTNPSLDIRIIKSEQDQFDPHEHEKYRALAALPASPHDYPDIHIKHRWPPDFTRPKCGTFIIMQPWEYGSLPVEWQRAMNDVADEVWVYTRYLKVCYERSGVYPQKVQVIPLGIDPALFNPEAPPLTRIHTQTHDRYCFLYNGGVTTRKGTDILVNAYLSEFSADEPVCLYIKDSNVYGKELSKKVATLAQRTDIAKIIYNSENCEHEELPGIYTAADCYVHPYRAEGYGLPIAEAMACGVPVIVTGGGACLDFVEPDSGYFIKCTLEKMKQKQVSTLDTVGYPFWLVPDMNHLRSVLRYVYSNRDKAQLIGECAGKSIRELHTWKNTAAAVMQRLRFIINPSGTDSDVSALAIEKDKMIDEALALLQSGNAAEAVPLFQKILLRFGENSLAYEGLGIAAFCRKDYNEACNLFSAGNRISPHSVDIIINWYEAAKITGSTNELLQPVMFALQKNNSSDELIAIAIEMGVL